LSWTVGVSCVKIISIFRFLNCTAVCFPAMHVALSLVSPFYSLVGFLDQNCSKCVHLCYGPVKYDTFNLVGECAMS
jgi:hypothetical protein